MNFGTIIAAVGQAAANAAYKIFAAWIKQTQPVDALKEIIKEVDLLDLINSAKREEVYARAETILQREWEETKGFVKDFAFAIAFDEFKKGL